MEIQQEGKARHPFPLPQVRKQEENIFRQFSGSPLNLEVVTS
jgi:hypothetical protein